MKKFLTEKTYEVEKDEKMMVVGHSLIFSAMMCDGVKPNVIEELGKAYINPLVF